jgi:hypothetical protein
MKFTAALIALGTLTAQAHAADIKSVYTTIDLKKCKQTLQPDGHVIEGGWACKGVAGYDVFLNAVDSREMVAFGTTDNANNCAGLKTFGGFNSAGKTIEWLLKDGKPIAAILRWTVSIDPEDSTKQATWLVVSKITPKDSCQMHYVAGSFPKANEAARKAADEKAEAFDCELSKPTFEPADKPPNINLESCSAQGRE